ncbi:glycosyltransferase family 2 protein [Sphingomonas sp. CFBP 8764]|jgi:GT2 family glycosyltransferase|nr:glycosyltransferase family 2 protein [Sphingomonas sp. CFBP 8764]
MRLSASLVLYNNDPAEFGMAIASYLNGSNGTLTVIDNSPVPLTHPQFADDRVEYVFAGENLGFGRGHNRALAMIGDRSDAHLLLNPDVAFGAEVLPRLLDFLQTHPGVGAIMPSIRYRDGSLQQLCKLLPTPVDLLLRRFVPIAALRRRINQRYELHGLSQSAPSAIPSLSGCFLLVRTEALTSIGGFDERFFMYMEDVDLVRRIGDRWTTMYQPGVSVTHGYAKASYSDPRLRAAHIRSALSYFAKWGFFVDRTRHVRNRATLERRLRQP